VRNAAALAVSEVRGDALSIVPSARLAVACAGETWMVSVSGFAAVRRQTALTPPGPSFDGHGLGEVLDRAEGGADT
jgi:hypothetical protein